MTKPRRKRPTDAQLAILNILWRRGPSTVREVHSELSRQRKTGYTTVLKMLQLMLDEGWVRRDDSERTHVYSASQSADRTRNGIVRDLIDRAFGGSAHKLVMQAISAKPASPEELREIRDILDRMEGGRS